MNTLIAYIFIVPLVFLAGCATTTPFHPDVPQGGRAVSITVKPGNAQHMLVASETGGIFITTDGGTTWQHISTLPSYTIQDVAYAPGNANIVIAAARADYRIANGPIWRSADGGYTWSRPTGSTPAGGPRCGDQVSAYSVAFDSGSNNVYVGTDCGLAVSNDLGVTWTHVAPDPTTPVNADKTQNRVWSVLAQSGGRLNLAADDGLWYSLNRGGTWNKAGTGPSVAQGGVNHAFAASPYNSSYIFHAGGGQKLYLTTDGGTNWSQVSSPSTWNRPVFVKAARAASGGANKFVVYFGDGIGLSRQTFTHIASGLVGSGAWTALVVDHADPADVAFDPTGTNPILVATDGGVHKPVQTVSLKANNGQYVVAEGGGGGEVNANRSQVGTWESFILIDTNGGQLVSGDAMHLRSINGHYMVAEGGGGREVKADRTEAREWETFIITRIGGGTIGHGNQVSLRAYNGQYVVAEGGGGGAVNANRNQVGPWETFTLEFGEMWLMAGSGPKGYNALQITEVTGQSVSGANQHQDLYYGTQDNNIVASSDGGSTWPTQICCEGFFLRTPSTSINHANTKVTGVTCAGCMNFITDPHLANFSAWSNPHDGDSNANDVDGNPFLIKPGHYIQNTINNDVTPLVNMFKLTTNAGASWVTKFTVTPELRNLTAIAGPASNPTVYQPVRRPGLTADGLEHIGLVRITNLYGPGTPAVADADMNGFGSLGIFPTMFAWYVVYGVNPNDPQHLIMADVESNEMKFSYDGGQNWYVDNDLTDLVTDYGAYRFRIGLFPLVTAIAWDPNNPCHILVGTAQNGVIRSTDSGNSWHKVRGSKKITNLSSLYFPPKGRVIASSYGRGLWKMYVKRTGRTCKPKPLPLREITFPMIFDPETSERIKFKDLGDPDVCPACQYVIVRNGRIIDLKLDGFKLEHIVISGGSIHQFDAGKKELPLAIPNSYAIAPGQFGGNERLLALAKQRMPIRGVIVEGTTLKGVITADKELPVTPARMPYVRIVSEYMSGGVPWVVVGGKIVVYGEGFVDEGANPVHIRLDDEIVAENVKVDAEGRFHAELRVNRMPGDYVVVVEQKDGLRLSVEKTHIKVVVQDLDEEKKRPPEQKERKN